MFANYVVARVKGVLTPFIIFPGDSKGLNRPLDALEDFDITQDVVSAGTLTWTYGANAQVTCYGRGTVVINHFSKESITLRSRGPEDASLYRELLSKAIGYMVLRFPGKYHPVLLAPGDSPDVQLLRQFQLRPHKAVLGAGWVDFGLSSGVKPVCFGDAVFDKAEQARGARLVKKQSRGLIDLTILQQAYVKPDQPEWIGGANQLVFA